MPLVPTDKIEPEQLKEQDGQMRRQALEALADMILKMIMRDLVIETERRC